MICRQILDLDLVWSMFPPVLKSDGPGNLTSSIIDTRHKKLRLTWKKTWLDQTSSDNKLTTSGNTIAQDSPAISRGHVNARPDGPPSSSIALVHHPPAPLLWYATIQIHCSGSSRSRRVIHRGAVTMWRPRVPQRRPMIDGSSTTSDDVIRSFEALIRVVEIGGFDEIVKIR